MKKPFVVLAGPTAVGKTKCPYALQKPLAVRSFLQILCRCTGIWISDQPRSDRKKWKASPHHLIDVLEPSEEFHVVKFQQMAKEAMTGIYDRGISPSLPEALVSISRQCSMTLILPRKAAMTHTGKNWRILPKDPEQKHSMKACGCGS